MTINKTFNEVTFWAPKAHQHFTLKHRIDPWESNYLKCYLSPKLTEDDRKKIDKIREEQRKSMISMLNKTKDAEDSDPLAGLIKEDEEDGEDKDSDGLDGEN